MFVSLRGLTDQKSAAGHYRFVIYSGARSMKTTLDIILIYLLPLVHIY